MDWEADRGGVLMLHGIGRHARSLARLETALRRSGFRTLNLDYPARTRTVAGCADFVSHRAASFAAGLSGPLHIVTHSMGGLVALDMVARHRPARLGRAVLLGPPIGGSEVADWWAGTWIFRRVFGPAGADLTTTRPVSPIPAGLELGVIAGDRSVNPLSSLLLIDGPNDGKVSVARTAIEGARGRLVLHVTHPFMMRNPVVIEATIRFLRHGTFEDAVGGGPNEVATVNPA